MEDVEKTIGFADPDEALVPDGWKEGDDIFAEYGEEAQTVEELGADGQSESATETAENEPKEEEDLETLIMGDEQGSETGQSAEELPEESTVDEPAETPEKTPRVLNLKVNHKEESVNLDDMTDEEIIALFQKGRAFDRLKEADDRRKFKEIMDAQIESGMTEDVAKLVAAAAVGGKDYSVEETEEEVPPAQDTAAQGHTDLNVVESQLKALYSDFKGWPVEVVEAIRLGADPMMAYMAYHEREAVVKAVAETNKKNAVLEQNAASAAKAPVRGVTGGGDVAPAKRDLFEEGFDAGSNYY